MGVHPNIHIPKEAIVYADFNTTKTVFVNIVSNAIKFTNNQSKKLLKDQF